MRDSYNNYVNENDYTDDELQEVEQLLRRRPNKRIKPRTQRAQDRDARRLYLRRDAGQYDDYFRAVGEP